MMNSSLNPARILIVDDHPIVQQGYIQIISHCPEFEVCGCAESEQQARELVRTTNPALAILDIRLKDGNGLELTKDLQQSHQGLKILIISAHDENLYAERALNAGALGYLCKHEATGKLLKAIQTVLQGEVFVSDQITRQLLRRRVKPAAESSQQTVLDELTDRELQVFELIGHGETTRQIADKLYLSPKTVERYKENIKQKLQIANATELIQKATRWVLER